MRSSDVRTKIIAAIEGSAVDAQASSVDVFTNVDIGTREIRSARDRLFTVSLATIPVREGSLFPTDLFVAVFEVTVMYSDSPGVEDRIGQDFERISRALDVLPQNNSDICKINLMGGPVQEIEGLVTATVSADVSYKLDSTV